MLEENLVTVRLGNVVETDDLVAEVRSVGDIDFEVGFFLLGVGRCHLLVSTQTGLLLGLTGLGRHAHPFEFPLQGLAALALGLLFLGKSLGLLFQPGGVVALPGNALAAVQFQDPAGYVVQEVTVVGDGNDRTLVLLQMGLQPLDGFGVQVVGGLVQKQHVRLLQQQAAQGHAAALTTGKLLHFLLRRRALQRIHGALQFGVNLPAVHGLDLFREFSLALDEAVHLVVIHGFHEFFGDIVVLLEDVHHLLDALLYYFQHGLFGVHLRFLLQVTHRVARSPDHFALVGFFHTGNDLHERGLTGTVETDDANLGTIEEAQVYVFENDFVIVGEHLTHPVHREDNLFVGHIIL